MTVPVAKRREVALARARRGAAFLDKKLGRGWRRKIKRSKLNLDAGCFPSQWVNPGCGCVIAQLDEEGSYSHGAQVLGFRAYSTEATNLGFLNGSGIPNEVLTDAWKQVIREGLA